MCSRDLRATWVLVLRMRTLMANAPTQSRVRILRAFTYVRTC